MSNRPSWTLVAEKAEELKTKILSKFPAIDVEYVNWVELSGPRYSLLTARGFPWPDLDVHAYMLIRGDLETAEEAATLSDNEVARIWEESGVVIQVQKTKNVWCKNSELLEAQALAPGQELNNGPHFKAWEDDEKGIIFLCLTSEQHDHDFGQLQKRFLAISR